MRWCIVLMLLICAICNTYGVRTRHRGVRATSFDENIVTRCHGGFDIYFVLDKSGSILPRNFQEQTVDFVEGITSRFLSKNVRISFIIFGKSSEVILPLTGDGNEIAQGLASLRLVRPVGHTMLSHGLHHANEQIRQNGGTSASVVITFTDGRLSDPEQSTEEAKQTRDYGGTILAVRIGRSKIDDLFSVADPPGKKHIFKGNTFDDLDGIVADIVETSCVEILSACPDTVCSNKAFNVSIYGNGFDKALDSSTVFCNFKLNGIDQPVKPFTHRASFLLCQAPPIPKHEWSVEVQVSVNGKSFVSSNVRIQAKKCTKPSTSSVPAALVPTVLLILIGLCLFWRCRNRPMVQADDALVKAEETVVSNYSQCEPESVLNLDRCCSSKATMTEEQEASITEDITEYPTPKEYDLQEEPIFHPPKKVLDTAETTDGTQIFPMRSHSSDVIKDIETDSPSIAVDTSSEKEYDSPGEPTFHPPKRDTDTAEVTDDLGALLKRSDSLDVIEDTGDDSASIDESVDTSSKKQHEDEQEEPIRQPKKKLFSFIPSMESKEEKKPTFVRGASKKTKWPTVDTSMIAGPGMRPMKITWGDTGATQAALHLIAAKGAKVVGELTVETPGELIRVDPDDK